MKKKSAPRTIVEDTLVPHAAFNGALRRIEQCFAYADSAREPICIALIGETRTGKSRAMEEFSTRHPSIRNGEGLYIPILRVTTPAKPTVKSLVELMLERMHDELSESGSENAKTRRLVKLMDECGTQMVMIDEFHHFVDKGSHKVIHDVANWLKTLVDRIRCVLIVAGLPTCQAVLEQNEQLEGRFSAPVMMPRFEWKIDEHREEFIAILSAFHESMSRYFDLPELDNADMAFRCYCATGGLMGYLTKFLRQVVWNALDSGKRKITLGDLAIAHDEAVWAKHGPRGLPNPFTKNFQSTPNEDLIERIRMIGVPLEQETQKRRRVSPPKKMKVTEVLSTA
ncbi:hypothetical protein P3T43_004806 [Paraburkholderia sp. GAS41]|uniref:TniB family NTP-binding protein n=1 Tax=Paraburkholderia sp. GAS41 TaxID=3035134 RepID=UPI003D2581FA